MGNYWRQQLCCCNKYYLKLNVRPPLSYIPLLPLLISFIAGIVLAEYSIPIWVAIIPALISVFLFWQKQAVIAICLIGITIGWINADIQSPKPLALSYTESAHQFTATVLSISETETSRHIVVKIPQIGKCQITTPSMFPIIKVGDIVSFCDKLTPPKNRHDLPDEWDMERYLYRQGIVATVYLRPDKISIVGKDDCLLWKIRYMQDNISALLGASSLSDETTEFLVATITGDDSLLSPDTRQNYSTSGLAHVLALSGLHVGLITIIITIALFPLYIMRHKRSRIAITIILLWVYAIMTGLSPSVTRAVIMTTIYLIGIILQRHHNSMNALFFAALIILLFSPSALYSVSFQLTFAAVLSILMFANRLNPTSPKNRVKYYIMSLVSVSISAMIGTGAIAAYYFHQFPLYFLLGNIIVVAILPVVIGGGVFLIILEVCGYDPQWLCAIIDFVYSIINYIAEFSGSIPGASINNIYFPAWLLIFYFATVATLFASLVYRRLIWWATTLMLAISTISIYYITKERFPQYEIYFPRDTYYTNIIARDGNMMYIFTTAADNKHEEIINRTKSRYRDYIGRRSIDSLTLVTDTFESPIMTCNGRNLILHNKHIVVVDNENDLTPCQTKPHYAILCRGFRGNINDVHTIINADTILLSNDLHPRRHNRYCTECDLAKIPYRSLRYRK